MALEFGPAIDGVPSVAWVLECGCEPMIQRCDQCDRRRAVRSALEAKRQLKNKLAEISDEDLYAECKARGLA